MSIRMDQPKRFDLVGTPVLIAGIGSGFEATISFRVHDGHDEVTGAIQVGGGTGEPGQVQAKARVGNAAFQLDRLFVEVFEVSPKDGSEINEVSRPVLLGTRMVDGRYIGFREHVVKAGDGADQDRPQALRQLRRHAAGARQRAPDRRSGPDLRRPGHPGADRRRLRPPARARPRAAKIRRSPDLPVHGAANPAIVATRLRQSPRAERPSAGPMGAIAVRDGGPLAHGYPRRVDRRAWTLLLALSAIWGASYC